MKPRPLSRLTARQKEVARLVAYGYSNAEIMEELCISLDTAKRHITMIFEEIGVKNRVQLAVWAIKNNVVNLDDIKLPCE